MKRSIEELLQPGTLVENSLENVATLMTEVIRLRSGGVWPVSQEQMMEEMWQQSKKQTAYAKSQTKALWTIANELKALNGNALFQI